MKPCIQCGLDSDSNFCPNCGQNQHIQRLTLKTFFQDFFSRVYGLDGAFPHTIIGLTKNPGLVAREYISGIRGKYVGPVGYYFLIFAIYLLIVQVSGFSLTDYLPNTEEYADTFIDDSNLEREHKARALARLIRGTIIRNIQYVHVLIVPIAAFWMGVFFKKFKYNFLENTVFSFFIHAQAILLNMFGFIVFIYSGFKSIMLISLLSTLYYAWCMSMFYTGRTRLASIMRGIITYGISYLSFYVFFALCIIIGVMLTGPHLN